jgi:hypothetical protein
MLAMMVIHPIIHIQLSQEIRDGRCERLLGIIFSIVLDLFCLNRKNCEMSKNAWSYIDEDRPLDLHFHFLIKLSLSLRDF